MGSKRGKWQIGYVLPVVLCLCLMGCAGAMVHGGTDFDATPAKTFQKGITSKAEVLRKIGPPLMKNSDLDGKETWSYMYTVARSTMVMVPGYGQGNTDISQKSLVLTFKRGVLDTMTLQIPAGLSEGLPPPPQPASAEQQPTWKFR